MTIRHIPEFDGLRGIAILLVLAFHFSIDLPTPRMLLPVQFGWCGVDLFFVLSGSLITNILLESKGAENYLRTFYARRVLRILPLYYGSLIVIFFLILPLAKHFGAPASWAAIPYSEQSWYWLHISNWHGAWGFVLGEPLGHFWSLAIEEQFYLVWPLLVMVCSPRKLLFVCFGLIVAAVSLRNVPILQAIRANHDQFLYRLTPTRLDAIAIGCCIPLILRDSGLAEFARRWSARALLATSAALLAFLLSTGSVDLGSESMSRFGYFLIAAMFGALVLHTNLTNGAETTFTRFLRWRFLRAFGAYSYGIYVIHPLFAPFIRDYGQRYLPAACIPAVPIILGSAVAYAAGWCSWHFFEATFIGWKRYFRYEDRAPEETLSPQGSPA